MDKLAGYRQIIQKLLSEYRDWAAGANQVGVQECVSFDPVRDHYFLFSVGWDNKRRDFGVTVYLRIEHSKIWIEEDWTKQGIANNLLEAGVPPEDIVLGFQHPRKRSLTEFAVA
ncbi:MAG: XisI protein [Cyanobacteria bacterium P01_D01_bin.1]